MYRKIVDYKILKQEDDYFDKVRGPLLKTQVLNAINAGWEPLGGVALQADPRSAIIMQAMVKYETVSSPTTNDK